MDIRIRLLQFREAISRRFVRLFVAAVFCALPLPGCEPVEANIPLLVSTTVMPDIPEGEAGKGFTCTGLACDAAEEAFLIGNCGKMLPEDTIFRATIVKVSQKEFRYLSEIKLYEMFPAMKDIQGLTIDTSDQSIFFCSFGERKVRHISKDGVDLGGFDLETPSGISYDARTDTLWVLTYTSLVHLSKTGEMLEEIPFSVEGQDQIYLDEENDTIYITAGLNSSAQNEVYRADLQSKKIKLMFTLQDSYGIEGIDIEGDSMYVLNDGYYHSARVPENHVRLYDISTLYTREEYAKIKQNTPEHE